MILNVIKKILIAEVEYLQADWWILLLGIGTAVIIKVYCGSGQLKSWIQTNEKASILGSIGFGTFTPLCACGTMAVVLAMFASYLPWGPIMAFLVASPLTSPSQFIFQAGFIGTELAVGVLVASLVLGITAGFLANLLEQKTSFFVNQYRIVESAEQEEMQTNCCEETTECCDQTEVEQEVEPASCCGEEQSENNWIKKWKVKEVIKAGYELGIKKVLLYFMMFIAIAQVVEMLVPTRWVVSLFSSGRFYSIPLAAIIGLPLYISGSSALPLLESILQLGAGEGAVLAFLIAGQGTGVAVITGMSTIIKKKALLFYVVFVLLGAIISGFLYQGLVI